MQNEDDVQIGFTLLYTKKRFPIVILSAGLLFGNHSLLPAPGAGLVSSIKSSPKPGAQSRHGQPLLNPAIVKQSDRVDEDVAKVLEKADQFRLQGSFLRAQSLLTESLGRHPGNFNLNLEQAKLLRSMGQFARSKALYLSLHAAEPNAIEPLVALSQMSLESLALDNALKYGRQVVSVAPDSRQAHLCLAAALIAYNALAEAEKELNEIERKFPLTAEVCYLRYQLFLKEDKREPALSALEAAVRLKPNNSSWIMDLSSLYNQEGDYNAALELLNRYLRSNPSSIEALSKVAALYEYNFHEYDKAIAIYQEILNLDPDVVDALVGIDRCKLKGNDLAAALKDQLWKFLRQSRTFGDPPRPTSNRSNRGAN